jgi:hypothetical protein
MNWLEQAACNGMDVATFVIDDKRHGRNGTYSSPHTRMKLANAIATCHQCPVQTECLESMLAWPDPPRDIVIAALTPRQARTTWLTAHGRTPHRHTKRIA